MGSKSAQREPFYRIVRTEPVRVAKVASIDDSLNMAAPRSLADLLASTAQQKLAAARARHNPDLIAEKPREAIFEALHIVADAIAGDGYVFAASGPKFVRKHGDFTFEISIQSGRNNTAGQRAAIWVHTAVYSRLLNAWRKKHASDWIRPKAPFPIPLFATQLGYLCDPAGWVEWDFADQSKRSSVVADLISSIQRGAYPLFTTFEGKIEEIAAVADQDWPPPEGVLSYLVANGYAELADKTLAEYLSKRDKFRVRFENFRQQFANDGLPSYRTALDHDLAAFAVATGYPWSEAGSISNRQQ